MPQSRISQAGKRYLDAFGIAWLCVCSLAGTVMAQDKQVITLPEPGQTDHSSLGQLLQQRRLLREFKPGSLRLTETGQLLWAAQGVTHVRGLRTAPSAGELYPLDLYVVAGEVSGLAAGIYHDQIHQHRLALRVSGDRREALADTAYMQNWLGEAAVIVVFTAVYQRTRKKYGQRAQRYVHMEVGHAAQNLFLPAEDLDPGTSSWGRFMMTKSPGCYSCPPSLFPWR